MNRTPHFSLTPWTIYFRSRSMACLYLFNLETEFCLDQKGHPSKANLDQLKLQGRHPQSARAISPYHARNPSTMTTTLPPRLHLSSLDNLATMVPCSIAE